MQGVNGLSVARAIIECESEDLIDILEKDAHSRLLNCLF
jgi:hypothetical protein